LYSLQDKEILKRLVEAMSYKMIADTCFISIETVSGHIKNIYKKTPATLNRRSGGKSDKRENCLADV